jgi:hypothetical protein
VAAAAVVLSRAAVRQLFTLRWQSSCAMTGRQEGRQEGRQKGKDPGQKPLARSTESLGWLAQSGMQPRKRRDIEGDRLLQNTFGSGGEPAACQ